MPDLTSGGKALVRAGRDADRPSAADRERVLAALRARLGDAAVLATGVAHVPPKTSGVSAVRSKLVKWGWVGPTAALVAGAWWFVPRAGHEGGKAVPAPSASVTKVAPPRVSAAPEAAPRLEASEVASGPTRTPTAEVGGRTVDPQKVPARSGDGLAEEVALLSRAETELRAGRPAKALLALAEHQRKFPRGALAEERTAARIQALCALGRNDEANAQLRQLMHISPNSAHEERARQACRDPRATTP